MTEDIQTLRDDIAFLRGMAESGRDGGEAGAVILIAAGGPYAIASVLQWAALTGYAGITFAVSNIAWLVALIVFFAALFWTKRRQGRSGDGSRAAALGWQAAGWALFVLFGALAIASWRTRSPLLISFSPCIVMALYGGAWSVAASVTRRRWLWLTALGSFAAALVSAWLVADTAQWLFYAVCLLLLAFTPGVVFLLHGRARTVAE